MKSTVGGYVIQGAEAHRDRGQLGAERLVVIEFPSREDATGVLKDPDVQPLFALRHRTTTSNLVLVDELRPEQVPVKRIGKTWCPSRKSTSGAPLIKCESSMERSSHVMPDATR